MGDEHLSTIPETESDKVIKCSVEVLFLIPSESKGISEDICDVPFCDNDHFDAEFGLINSLLSRDISITSPKIDFLPEEFAVIDKIEALNLTPIPFVLKYPSSSPIPVVDSDFLIEEVDTFLVSEDSIPPGGGEIVFSQNVEDDDSFTFVIRTFLPYLTYPEDSPLLLSTGSEDTIFDPGIST
ncbi:hypothetical protein Tco_0213378 [Tanacetum coccineum]